MGSVKEDKFLVYQSDYQILSREFVLQIWLIHYSKHIIASLNNSSIILAKSRHISVQNSRDGCHQVLLGENLSHAFLLKKLICSLNKGRNFALYNVPAWYSVSYLGYVK